MNGLKAQIVLAVVLCLSLAAPTVTFAKWKDESGNLDFGGGAGVALAVVAVAGLVTWYVLKKRKGNGQLDMQFGASLVEFQKKKGRAHFHGMLFPQRTDVQHDYFRPTRRSPYTPAQGTTLYQIRLNIPR